MSDGRWDPQTRLAVVIVGVLAAVVGVLATFQWHSGAGAAALVIGGLVVVLSGVAGGTILGPRGGSSVHFVTHEAIDQRKEHAVGAIAGREPRSQVATGGTVAALPAAPTQQDAAGRRRQPAVEQQPAPVLPPAAEPRPTGEAATPPRLAEIMATDLGETEEDQGLASAQEAGEAQEAGDTEGSAEALLAHLRATAPYATAYHEAARTVIVQALDGPELRPATSHPLGPLTVVGLPVIVDIRAGTGFSLALMRRTYLALLEGSSEIQALLVVVNTRDAQPVEAIVRMRDVLHRPVVVVPWRVGEPMERIANGVARVLRTIPPRSNGWPENSRPASVPQPRRSSDDRSSDDWVNPQPAPSPKPTAAEPANPEPATLEPEAPEPEALEPVATEPTGPEPDRPESPGPDQDDAQLWQAASDLHWRGQLPEAEYAYRTVLAARAETLGWDHPSTLTARDQHATVLRDLDSLAEALVECDDVLGARTRVLGPDHPDTLTSRSHLATIYLQQGDLDRARDEHEQVLAARSRVLGITHPETLISRSNLAKVYQQMGDLEHAIAEHATVMRQRSALLGMEHRDTLMSQSLLATALHEAGKLAQAEFEHRAVLAGRLRSLGANHLDTAVSRHRLAGVLRDQNRMDEAVDEYRAAREIYAELLGAASPFARAAAADLVSAERALKSQRAQAIQKALGCE